MEARRYFKELHESVLKIHEESNMSKRRYFLMSFNMRNLLSAHERLMFEGRVKAPRKKFVNYGDNG